MAILNTLTLTNNKVQVAETGGAGGARTYTLKPDYNIFPHPHKDGKIILTDDADPSGNGEDTVEFDIDTFAGNPSPGDVNATVVWLKDNYFKGLSIAASSGGATESTLLSVLGAIKDTQDVEIKLVRDTGDTTPYPDGRVIQQVRSYDQDTELWTTTYEKVDGSSHTVLGALEYLDASAVLNLILTELQGGLDVTFPSGTNTTDQYTVSVSTGSPIAAGFKKVSIANLGVDNATVKGNTLEPGFAINFEAEEGKSLDAIAYTAGATSSLKIVTIA